MGKAELDIPERIVNIWVVKYNLDGDVTYNSDEPRDERGRWTGDDERAARIGWRDKPLSLAGPAARVAALASHAYLSLPRMQRLRLGWPDPAAIDRLGGLLRRWNDDAGLDDESFRERYLNGGVDLPTVRNLKDAAAGSMRARTAGEMALAGGQLAAAMTAIGVERWERFIENAEAKAVAGAEPPKAETGSGVSEVGPNDAAADATDRLPRFSLELNRRNITSLRCENCAPKFSYDAFSGNKSAGVANNPRAISKVDEGPIPPGTYYIVERQAGGIGSQLLAKVRDLGSGAPRGQWFALFSTDTLADWVMVDGIRRGEFRLHPEGPAHLSEGCITLSNADDFANLREFLLAGTPVEVAGVGKVYGIVDVIDPSRRRK